MIASSPSSPCPTLVRSRDTKKVASQIQGADEFLFADDMAKGAPTEEKMQKGVDQVSDSCDSYDLTISIKKAEVVYRPAPGKPYKEPTITVKGQALQVVDKFTYLGSTLSRAVHIDDEINARIAKASAAFGRLCGSVWDQSGIRLVLVLFFVALWFILRGDLLYVFPCVILFLCFSVLLVLRLPRLGKRELILVLFVRLFELCLFGFVGFLFLLGSGKGCGL